MSAPAIFPNNDNKYHASKTRSQAWCWWQNKTITWSKAKDRPIHGEFQNRPYLQQDKVKWLTYHDKNCDKLYGMLPLAVGLPVMLVDHLDRNPEKQLLRGKTGRIHSWVNDEAETTIPGGSEAITLSNAPACVFVDFNTKAWIIPCALGPGIYPILRTERTLYLDGYRGKKSSARYKKTTDSFSS